MPPKSNKPKRGPSRRTRHHASGDRGVRARAKALLRTAGEALERGDTEAGARHLEAALAEDPTFVEPALSLARIRDSMGEDVIADALVEEAVRRANGPLEAMLLAPGGPKWWREPETRPYMKALIARGWRLLDRDDLAAAAAQFKAVYDLCPDEDPLEAGVYAAETYLRAADLDAALGLYCDLEEQPAVCYGRALALAAQGELQAATVSLWLGVFMNGQVAAQLVSAETLIGLERQQIVGDPDEAEEILGRIRDLWGPDAIALLERLLQDQVFRDALEQWHGLADALNRADNDQSETRAIAEIESFLAVSRIEREVTEFLKRLDGDDGKKPGRLPVM